MTGIPVARLFGIEIRLQLGWILVVALVAVLAAVQVASVEPTVHMALQWFLGGVVAAGFFLSAVAHDLSHAIEARRRGLEVKSILISFFGGSTPLDPSSPNARDDLAIAAVGPLVSLGIGAACAVGAVALWSVSGSAAMVAGQVLAVLGILNLLLGGVNLVPAYPLDGGRIVRAIAWRRTGNIRDGWQAAGRIGRIVGLLVITVGLGVMFAGDLTNGAMVGLSGWFLLLSSRAIRERVKVDDMIGHLTVGDVMEHDTPTVHPGLTVDTFAGQLLDGEVPTTAIPVIERDAVVGILGARQVQRIRPGTWATTRVEEVMVKPPRLPMVAPGDGLVGAVEQLHKAGLDGLPVVEDGRLVGVLTRRSVGQAIQAQRAGAGPAGGSPGTGTPKDDATGTAGASGT
jgi:Zn-dependent protease/CBS domain-containing protein